MLRYWASGNDAFAQKVKRVGRVQLTLEILSKYAGTRQMSLASRSGNLPRQEHG